MKMTAKDHHYGRHWILALLFLSIVPHNSPFCEALEAKFTHMPDKDGNTDGPLPQSQKQRDQLSKLYDTIANAPDPQATIEKIAKDNGMGWEELSAILMKNQKDMNHVAGGDGGGGGAPPLIVCLRLISSFPPLLASFVHRNPRSFVSIMISLIIVFYAIVSAPRNGILIKSSGGGGRFGGHSTFLSPPKSYLSRHVKSDRFLALDNSLPSKVKVGSLSKGWKFNSGNDDDQEMKGGVVVERLSKKQKRELSMVVTMTKRLPFEILLPDEDEVLHPPTETMTWKRKGKVGEGGGSKEERKAWDDALNLALSSLQTVLSSRRFSEYTLTPNQFCFHSPHSILQSSSSLRHRGERSGKKGGDSRVGEGAVVVLQSLGVLHRFGIQPLRLVSENENELVFSTLNGGHFDGEVRIKIGMQRRGRHGDQGVEVSVALLVPRKGRSLSKKMATKLLSNLIESIATSAMTEATRKVAYQYQLSSYRGKATTRATKKRHLKFENMKKMEEMAEERRRRWQRTNPDAGHYSPSGIRMRSPNHC